MTYQVIAAAHPEVKRPRSRAIGPQLSMIVARVLVASIWLSVFLGGVGVAHAANDVVITTTGDRLVGEIKKVEKDVLTLSTDYSDSDFKIKWEKIASIAS